MRQAAAVRWPWCSHGRVGRQSCRQALPTHGDRHRSGRSSSRLMAAADAMVASSAEAALADDFMQERIEFLKADMANLFTAGGPDKSAYEEQVVFRDPISTYSSLSSFLLNLRFLRAVFGPELVLHDVRRTGAAELTCRWTMRMTLQFLKHLSALRHRWNPELLFTGISVMQINPRTGRFCSSVDHWDAIEDRSYPSIAAVKHVAAQMFSPSHMSESLPLPQYLVLRRFADCEVRRYERPPLAAAVDEVSGAQEQQLGSHFAAMTFKGVADDQMMLRQLQMLRQAMDTHGLCPRGPDHLLVQRDQADTRATMRRHDVLVPLKHFELW